MTESALTIQRQGDVVRATLNDPRRANALSLPMLEALTDLYRRDLVNEGIRAVILGAEGKHFSAGADLEHLQALRHAGREENRRDSLRLRALFDAVLRQEALTVALVQGACVAGGCGLATAHDFVIAENGSRFLYSEVRIGFVAALVATFLPMRVRGSHIRELLLNPEFIDASRALEIGLVNRVVERDELAAAGDELVAEILERASPSAIALTKRLLLQAQGRPLEAALDVAAEINAEARLTDDCRRGIATFLETKRTPNWRQE